MKVLLATPAYGGNVTSSYMMSVLNAVPWAAARGVELQTYLQSGESLITRARNDMVATFLAGDWDKLLWVDADIGFSTTNLERLLSSPHEVVAGVYPLKRIDWEAGCGHVGLDSGDITPHELKAMTTLTVVNAVPGSAPDEQGYQEMLDVGTGFLCIDRWVLELMVEGHPELHYITDKNGESGNRWALFDTMIEDGRYLSEDYAFCRRWQAMGGKVWADVASPILRHQGLHTFGE